MEGVEVEIAARSELRRLFDGPLRITRDLVHDRWFVELARIDQLAVTA